MIDNQSALVVEAVGVRKDLLVHAAFRGVKVIEQELLHVGEQVAAMKEREDAPLMSTDESVICSFIPFGATEFHPIFFRIAFHLSMTEHGQTGQCGQDRADTKIFVAISKLLNGGFLIGIIHEVDVTLKNLRIEFKRAFNSEAIFSVIFVTQHVHERGVIYAVHTKCADKISFHHPEGFGKQKCIGNFLGNAVNNLAPKFFGDFFIEFGFGYAVLRT